MRSLTRRGAGAGLIGLAAAAPLTAWAEPLRIEGAQTLAGRKDRTSRMTTPVFINGTGPHQFVVDTGSSRSVMAAELAAELGLEPGPPARIHGILGVQETPTVDARSFTAGPLRLPLTGVPTLLRADLGCDGFLGLDAFRDRRVLFDFRRNRVDVLPAVFESLDEPAPYAALTADVLVRARQRFGQLTITEADAVGSYIGCFVDSGAQGSVGNMAMRQMVKARGGDRNFTPIGVVLHGATGQEAKGEVAEVPHIRIGLLNFTGFRMAFADLHTFSLWGMQDKPAMMMGMDLLSLFEQVTINFRQNFVRFRMAEAVAFDFRG
jgi:hypothetical protein